MLEENIQSLITAANATTGKADADMTAATKSLIDGFGGGSGGKPEEVKTVEITTNGPTEVLPTPGSTMSKVVANVNVPTGSGGLPDGITGVYYGTFTPIQDTSAIEVEHNLNATILTATLWVKDYTSWGDENYNIYYSFTRTNAPVMIAGDASINIFGASAATERNKQIFLRPGGITSRAYFPDNFDDKNRLTFSSANIANRRFKGGQEYQILIVGGNWV